MAFDLKAQPASISSAICGLRRIIIVFSFFQTNKMEMETEFSRSFTTVFVDARLWKTKHPRKRFQNFRQSYALVIGFPEGGTPG